MPSGLIATGRSFVDTNVFAYAHDLRNATKRAKALAIIRQLSNERRMVVSTQVVNELCAVLLRGKAGTIVDPLDLANLVDEMDASAEVLTLTLAMTKGAARAVHDQGMSWYDALIWAAASAGGCEVIYTEDVPGRPDIEGVRYENPFA